MTETQEQPKTTEIIEPTTVEEIVEIQAGTDAESEEETLPMTLEEKLAENRARINAAGVDAPKVQQGETKQSRQEKKARKAITKLGLKIVPGVTRVALRKKSMLLFVNKPEVFKSNSSDTYVVFGEIKTEDLSKQASQFQAAKKFEEAQQHAAVQAASLAATAPEEEAIIEEEEEEEEYAEVEAGEVEEKDIDLVIQQACCNRNKAVKALQKNNGDIVNAIMELTIS
jgi:nascent polypeptide-associated complex subunit alpha